jgi:hypothetical protein
VLRALGGANFAGYSFSRGLFAPGFKVCKVKICLNKSTQREDSSRKSKKSR